MRIAVTGATGNIGTAVLRRLSRDDHELLGLARRVPGGTVEAGRPLSWRSVDLTRVDPGELADSFRGVDAVVHLAWGFQPSHDLAYLRELGVGGTRRVVEAMTAAGVPHLIHMSSVGTYAPHPDDTPVDETWSTDGVRTARYSRHKAEAERLLDEVEARGDLRTVTRLRPAIVGQRSAGSALLRYGIPGLIPARALDWLPVLPLDRGLRIPIVHADDVADAVAGDAAGYVDALTGEGLALAFAQAEGAVRAVTDGAPQRYERDWASLTRRYRWLTTALLLGTRPRPLRRALVPAARLLPSVFDGAVTALARPVAGHGER